MKLIICGHSGHGKDEFAKFYSSSAGLKFASSSMVACENFVFPTLKDRYGYKTPMEALNDRHNHQAEWFTLIRQATKENPTLLADMIFENNDIYVGLRSDEELEAIRAKYPEAIVIWLDGSNHCPRVESKASNKITRHMCDVVISNVTYYGGYATFNVTWPEKFGGA